MDRPADCDDLRAAAQTLAPPKRAAAVYRRGRLMTRRPGQGLELARAGQHAGGDQVDDAHHGRRYRHESVALSQPSAASPSCTKPAAATMCGEGSRRVSSALSSGPVIAHVRIAELAAQKLVIVFASAPEVGSAIEGRARPAAANPVAMSAPTPFRASRVVRLRRADLVPSTMLEL